jgi:hemolysin activation/secretion protein
MDSVTTRSGLVGFGLLFCLLALSEQCGFAQSIPAQLNPRMLTPPPAPVLLGVPKPAEPVILNKVQVDNGPEDAVDPSLPDGLNVSAIEWVGKTSLKKKEFQPIFDPYLNRALSRNDLNHLSAELTELYHKLGFISSYAIVPAQDASQGVLRVEAREGKIGDILFDGNTHTRDWFVRSSIRSEMRPNDILNVKTLKSEMARINRNAPFILKANVDTMAGEAEPNDTLPAKIQFEVKEKNPWQISTTLDNQGRPYIGTYRGGIGLTNTNLLGIGDRLNLSFIGSARQMATVNNYTIPLNGRGDEVSFNQFYQRESLDPRKFLAPGQRSLQGSSYSHWVTLSHPWDKNRTWTSTLTYVTATVRTFVDDDLRQGVTTHFGVAGLNFNKSDRFGQTTARLEGAFGKSSTTKWRGIWRIGASATRTLNLPHRNTLIARGAALYTSDVLPVGQDIQVGGAYSVRGYTEALITGDKGYFFSLEDRFPIPLLKKASPWLDNRVRGAVFFDVGQGFLTRSSPRFRPG